MKLSVCPYEIQNFGNSTADISILGQFHTYLQFQGEKYLNTFIVTNANDCPNLLSHGATFRMGVLLPNYLEENVVKGENVPNFKISTSTGSSNVFQILQDLWLKQYQETSSSQTRASQPSTTAMTCTTTQSTPLMMYGSTSANQNTGMATPITSMSELSTSPRTTMPAETTPSSRQPTSEIHQNSSHNGHPPYCMHVHQPQSRVCKPGESLALRKVKTPHNGKTSVSRFPLTKQDILSQYSGCFEGIGHFPGDLYRFHLKPDYKPARHAPRKVPVHLEAAFKEEIDSLVKQGILEEVKEHTDWVNSYVIVEKDTGNQHAPNHTVKKKLRICLDPRDLNEVLEREPYHTRSVDEITAKLQGKDEMEHDRNFLAFMEKCMENNLTLNSEKIQFKQSQVSFYGHIWSENGISPDPKKIQALKHVEFPPDKEIMRSFLGMTNYLNRYSVLSAHLAAPLSLLIHQATDYKPGKTHLENFQ